MIYRIRVDDSGDRIFGYINGSHRDGGLPGVTCHGCGSSWAAFGLAYPGVDVTLIDGHEKKFVARNVTVPVYEQIRREIVPFLPLGAILKPGTNFGPVSGKVVGRLGDFTWLQGGMLMKQVTYERMKLCGLRLPLAYSAKLTFPKGSPEVSVVELSVPPVAILSPKCVIDQDFSTCEVCGRAAIKTPREMVIKASSIPSGLDVFQTRETSTKLATQHFKDYCVTHGLKNITFLEVGVAMEE